jgi:glycosyltransferase involved in cell wall biosynthesis
MKRLNIVHFLSCEGPWGDATAALSLACQQQRMGFDVRVLIGTSPYSQLFVQRAMSEKVSAAEVRNLPLQQHGRGLSRILLFRAELTRHRPDVLHFHERGLFMRSADVVGTRMVPASVRVATIQYPHPWPDHMLQERRKWARVASLLDRVICPSSFSKAQQLEAGLPESLLTIIPNVVNVARILVGDAQKARQELGLNEGDVLILFLARLDMQKCPLVAMKAFERVAGRFQEAHMAVAGTGEMEEECRDFARLSTYGDRIHLLGYRTDVQDLMQAADIYILPTVAESFGNTLVEAMAARTAVVTSRIPPIVGEVVPEEAGLFAPVEDAHAFGEALTQLLSQPDLRIRMAEIGHREVLGRFSAEAVAGKHLDLYRHHMPSRLAVEAA